MLKKKPAEPKAPTWYEIERERNIKLAEIYQAQLQAISKSAEASMERLKLLQAEAELMLGRKA